MRILNSLILIVFFSFGISIPFKNRYIVPLYLKVGLSVGYNDNIFLFSDEEKNDNDSYKYMGNSSTYDSSTIKPDIRILYSPHIVDGKTTNFIFYSSLSNYPNVVDNNSIYYSMRFEYKIKSYNWVKFGYRNSLNNFLRYYNDSDLPGNDYIECDYSSESIYVSYSLNFNEYGWSKFRLLASEQFYNPNFTEFDTRINEISFKHHLDYKLFQISISLLRSFADNISYKNGILNFDCGNTPENFDQIKFDNFCEKDNSPDLQGSHWAPHLIHRDLWTKVGGFSVEFDPGDGSDPDLCMKLWNEGVRTFKCISRFKVYHFGSVTTRKRDININNGTKKFLLKFGFNPRFFRKFYLRGDGKIKYLGPLDDPKLNFSMLLGLIINKFKYYYYKIF